MKAVDFYKLPRSIQDRFVGSVMSGFPPAPILASKGAVPNKIGWLALSGVCLIGVVVTTRLGYGSLDSALSLHSWKALPLYLGLVFGVAFGLVQAFARLTRERALPYSAGVYLFPACVIDARNDQFKIYETKDLQSVDVQGSAVRAAFAGGTNFSFPLVEAAAGPTMVSDVQAARDRAMHAHATEDAGELVAVDPLHNPRFSSPVGPRDPYQMKMPPWGKLGFAVAGVVAVAFGPAIWAFRNHGSDKTMYATATKVNDSATYRAYLERGDKYKPEVSGILLPRSELRDAEKAGTVDALLDYKKSHPSSQIGGEVQTSIRAAMLSELEKAKAPGTLAALKDFATKYPEHGVDAELKEATHAIYTRELNAFKAKVPNSKEKPQVLAFADRLFAWAERNNNGKIEVRIRRKAIDMGRPDSAVAKAPNFMGTATYPHNFFDDKHLTAREKDLTKTMTTRIDAGISPSLFEVVGGPSVPTEPDTWPEAKVPTLFIAHGVDWSGHFYTWTRPRGTFVGLTFTFEAAFVVPGDPKPFKFKWDFFRMPYAGNVKEEDGPFGPGQAEDKVYGAMSDGAFDQFADKLLGVFFKDKEKDKDK
jgi:hypothetical protein